MGERRRERILRICDELIAAGVPASVTVPAREYAETITYCGDCGHERGQYGLEFQAEEDDD